MYKIIIELRGYFENPATMAKGLEDLNKAEKTENLLIQFSKMHLGIKPHRNAKGEPREHPHETNRLELEGVGFFISQARDDTNNRVFECDANRLEEKKLNGRPFREVLEEQMFCNCMEESRDEECREKFEVGRKCASWDMEGVCKKICVG